VVMSATDNTALQFDIWDWTIANFGDNNEHPVVLDGLGLGEESGEVLRAILKREEGIRGTRSEWTQELFKEVGDVAIKLFQICAREGVEFDHVIAKRWKEVSQRDFRGNPQQQGISPS
jgi:NTP pyrophosphatase (non-canonical NTP hydrolase)